MHEAASPARPSPDRTLEGYLNAAASAYRSHPELETPLLQYLRRTHPSRRPSFEQLECHQLSGNELTIERAGGIQVPRGIHRRKQTVPSAPRASTEQWQPIRSPHIFK
ncbi:hypothetical protein L596_020627 [Steinernema carpocapsae]|uniref:Uncharacterized protein n=1 Tax=Steinernema carpocapsae TaxID=34508 RepID=A0A4U5MU38_STECR|nr:hypothetical protein L596_020627 [Steinernema carpocapsae]